MREQGVARAWTVASIAHPLLSTTLGVCRPFVLLASLSNHPEKNISISYMRNRMEEVKKLETAKKVENV